MSTNCGSRFVGVTKQSAATVLQLIIVTIALPSAFGVEELTSR